MSYLHSLSVFTMVVEEKSFSAAAKKLNLTQPTVSFHIDNLERHFGCLLFHRTAKGVTLSIYGQTLYESTRKIHQIAIETESQIHALVAGEAGQITLGASTIPGEYILPAVLSPFLRCHPKLRISIRTASSKTILTEFSQGKFPISIVGIKPDAVFQAIPIWEDQLVLAAHPDLARAINKKASIEEILAQPLIVRESSSGTNHTVFSILKSHNIDSKDLQVVLEVTSNEALKSALLQKAGLGFISSWAVQYELKEKRLEIIHLPNIKLERTFYALCQPTLIPTCVQNLWNYLSTYKPTLG